MIQLNQDLLNYLVYKMNFGLYGFGCGGDNNKVKKFTLLDDEHS